MQNTISSLSSNLTTIHQTMTVKEQVAFDLNRFLDQPGDRQKKLNLISKKIDVHLKTLNRICLLENQPTYMTVFKIYRFLLNENDDVKLLEKCPDVVKTYLKKYTQLQNIFIV